MLRYFYTKFFVVCGCVLGIVLPGAFALAQQSPSTPQQAAVLATVNIQNAKIISQQGNVFHISFDLTNRVIPQSGVMFGVMLVSNTAQGQTIADQYIYPDSVILAEHSSVHENIVYTAPASLSGTFDVVLTSKNASGFPFAIDDLGSTTLQASGGVALLANTCYVQVAGENTQYTLMQGVDIAPTENLTLTCEATNNGTSAISVTPTYETHYRTVYGSVVPQTGGSSDPIALKVGETKTLTLALSKATAPQAYDVLVTLGGGSVVSNPIDVHYVIQGDSATIQDLSLDKNYYAAGDTAELSVLWSPSADMFSGSRKYGNATTSLPQGMTVAITMTDVNGVACITPLNQPVPNQPNAHIPLSIIHDCQNPHLSFDLKDSSGNVLAHQDLVLMSTATSFLTKSFLLLVLLGAALAALVLFFRSKKRHA